MKKRLRVLRCPIIDKDRYKLFDVTESENMNFYGYVNRTETGF